MNRKPRLAFSLLLVGGLLGASAQAEKKKPVYEVIQPNQVVEIPEALKTFATANKACVNDAWASAVVTVLRAQKLDLTARNVAVKLAGGDGCLHTLPDTDRLRKSVEGDYSLGNGRRARVTMTVSPGPPNAPDPLAEQLHANVPPIAIYKGQPVLLYGLTYDDHIVPGVYRQLWITELRFVNPAANVGSEQRNLVLTRQSNEANNIEAIIKIKVQELGLMQLETR
jgi:hypothetical protein